MELEKTIFSLVYSVRRARPGQMPGRLREKLWNKILFFPMYWKLYQQCDVYLFKYLIYAYF